MAMPLLNTSARLLGGAVILSLVLTACSSDDDNSASSTTRPVGTTVDASPSTIERPAGPAADVSEELTGGKGVFIGSSIAGQLDPGYIERDYVAQGTAT